MTNQYVWTHQSITLYICKFNLMPMVLSSADSGVSSGSPPCTVLTMLLSQCETTRAFLHSLEAGFDPEGLTGQRYVMQWGSVRERAGGEGGTHPALYGTQVDGEWIAFNVLFLSAFDQLWPMHKCMSLLNCDYIMQSHLGIACMHFSCRVWGVWVGVTLCECDFESHKFA